MNSLGSAPGDAYVEFRIFIHGFEKQKYKRVNKLTNHKRCE